MAVGQVSDLEINNNIRRIMTKRRIDVNKITYRTSHGTVSIGGELVFVGKKIQPEELVHEIESLESFVNQVKGVKDCRIDFDGYEKSDEGDWIYKGSGGAPEKKGKAKKSEDDILKDKIKARVLETLENMQYNDAGQPLEQGGETSDKTDEETAAKNALSSAPKELLEEFLSNIKSLVIKCGDCESEFNYCPKCGSKIKITFVTDEEEWNYDGKNVTGGKKSGLSTSAMSAPSTSAPVPNIHDLLDEDEEVSGHAVKKEEEVKEEKKELTLAEKAKLMLQKSKEDGIKKKGWLKNSRPKVDFDDL